MKKLLFILSLVLLTANASAENSFKNKQFIFNSFEKGLNTKVSPLLLDKSFADVCENIRFKDRFGSLTKRGELLSYGTADTTEDILGMHRLYLSDGSKVLIVNHGDEIETGNDSTGAFTTILDVSSGDYRWQWLTWNDKAIGTDGYNQPVKYDGSSASATYLGSLLATNTLAGTGPTGTYHYKVSFYTASYEVAFNVVSNALVVAGKDIALSMIPIGPDTYGGEDVVGRKIYRHKTGASTYYLLSNGTIANNTATTLTDSDTDAELSATTYPTTYTCTPPKGKLCIIHYNRLFIANNPTYPSRIFYTDDGNPDYFIPTDYYWNIRQNDGDQITFIKHQKGVLIIGKENSIQHFYTDGSTPSTDWSVSDPFSNIGCKAMYSAQESPVGIIYLGSDGLYVFNGLNSQLVSELVTPEINDIQESNIRYCWGQYYQSQYFLTYPSAKTGSSVNNRVLVFDLLAKAYSIDRLSVNCFTTFNSGTDWDVMYSGSSGDGEVFVHQGSIYEVRHVKQDDFSGTFTDARYVPTLAQMYDEVAMGDEDAKIEIARTEDIDDLTGVINDLDGTIDRDSLTGSYVSPGLNTGADSYDKIYWGEQLVSSSDDVTIAIRSASTEAGLTGAWSDEYTDPSGSDISALTADDWTQYRISLTTSAYTHTPIVYNTDGYTVRLTYYKSAAAAETTIPLNWRSGLLDLGFPGYRKTLTKFHCFHEGVSGTLKLTFTMLDYNFSTEKYEEEIQSFDIDLTEYPNYYMGYFDNGALTGELLRLEITNNDLKPLSIDKVILIMDGEPLI